MADEPLSLKRLLSAYLIINKNILWFASKDIQAGMQADYWWNDEKIKFLEFLRKGQRNGISLEEISAHVAYQDTSRRPPAAMSSLSVNALLLPLLVKFLIEFYW